jgi:adenine-specific DNA-methyltransferase
MDEVFGALLPPTVDYLLWYARERERVKYRQLFVDRKVGDTSLDRYDMLLLKDGTTRRLTKDEMETGFVAEGAKRYQLAPLYSEGASAEPKEFLFKGKKYIPRADTHWKTTVDGLSRLAEVGRVEVMGSVLRYRRFVEDFPVLPITDRWESTQTGTQRIYAVQTSPTVVQRCMLMTTDPGDLVLDPTCGSGTTAYVAEQWGRRWITIDTSRVPLALARQRLLTATFPYYELKDESRGPAGGFTYKRKQNNKGEEVGGIVPHVTLKSIANNEPPAEEVLVDRPEQDNKTTRVTGPFCFEATIPTPVDWEGDSEVSDSEPGRVAPESGDGSFLDRMLEVLRKSPVLTVGNGKSITLKQVRRPAKTLSLSAEAIAPHTPGSEIDLDDAMQIAAEKSGQSLELSGKPVAILFGPENGAVSQKAVYEAAMEARAKVTRTCT